LIEEIRQAEYYVITEVWGSVLKAFGTSLVGAS
jgi:hypothetical protein